MAIDRRWPLVYHYTGHSAERIATFKNQSPKLRGISFGCVFLEKKNELHTPRVSVEDTCAVKL